MTDAAIRAHYHDYKRVLGRKVLQIVLEVPLEQEGEVHAKIGYPSPDGSTWVGIARLVQEPSAKPEKERRHWPDIPRSQQAGIACENGQFGIWLARDDEKQLSVQGCIEYVRRYCGIKSRADLDSNPIAAAKWDELYSDFERWRLGAAA